MNLKLIAIAALTVCLPVVGQVNYGGPQILSRNGGSVGGRPGDAVGFQFYAGVAGAYESGLLPASVDSAGNVRELGGLYSVAVNLGAYGKHKWRHTTLGLDYAGDFRHYPSLTSYDTSDHVVGLEIVHQHSRRLQLNWRTNAGTVSRYYVTGVSDVADVITPANYALFDSRAYYLETTAGAVYEMTPRLSFSVSGEGFAVRHRSRALVGVDGYGAQGDLAYRLTRRRTLDFSYRYTHFDYVRGFGETDMHTYMVGLSQALGRRWQVSASVGAVQVSTIGIESVAADPLVTALFGSSGAVPVAFSRSLYLGSGQATLQGKFRRSSCSVQYSQMPSAGNGVYLTSKQENAQADCRYIGFRRLSFGAFGGGSKMSGIAQEQLGAIWYANGGVYAGYKVLRSVDATLRYDARNLQVDAANGLSRLGYMVSVGINWHPSEIPISFW